MNAGFLSSDLGRYNISNLLECARFGRSSTGNIHHLCTSREKPCWRWGYRTGDGIYLQVTGKNRRRENFLTCKGKMRGCRISWKRCPNYKGYAQSNDWTVFCCDIIVHRSLPPCHSQWLAIKFEQSNSTSQIQLQLYFNSTKSNSTIQPGGIN